LALIGIDCYGWPAQEHAASGAAKVISPDCDGLRSRLIAMDCHHLSPSDRPIWQVLLKVIKPYTRISIGFIAREINISPAEVEQLLVTLILDGMIDGSIDQLSQQLHLNQSSTDKAKYQAAEKWATQLQTLQQAVIGKLA